MCNLSAVLILTAGVRGAKSQAGAAVITLFIFLYCLATLFVEQNLTAPPVLWSGGSGGKN